VGRWAAAPVAVDNRAKRLVQRSRVSAEARAILLAAVFTALYFWTRTAYYSVDAVRIAGDILTSERSKNITTLLHPGYLLFAPLCAGAWDIARAMRYSGGPLPVMASVNCICGGVGIGMLSLLLRAVLTRSRALTVLVPIALGFSFGYWMIATDGRAEMPATAVSIVALYLLVLAMLLPNRARAAAAGLAVAIASLLHIFAALLLIVGAVAICLGEYTQGTDTEENRARLTNVAVFLIAGIVPVAIVYLIVGSVSLHLSTFSQWQSWWSVGASRDWWFSPHPLKNLRMDAYAFRRALFAEPGAKTGTFHLSEARGVLHAGLYWSTLLLWFTAVYAMASATAFLIRTHYGSFMVVALASAGLYALVFTCVNPGDFFYWVPVTIASSVIMAICCSYYRGRRGGWLWLAGIACWTAIFAASNYVQFIGPHRSQNTNPNMIEARFIENHTNPGDITVESGFGDDASVEAYLPYFGHRAVFSIRESLEKHGGNVTLVARDLQQTVARSHAVGNRSYVLADLFDDPDIRRRLRDEYGIRDTQQLLGNLQRAQAWKDPLDPLDLTGGGWKLIAAPSEPSIGGY
jgi:hypothetical protein